MRIGRAVFFFFSSRRRHTRYWRDWSSDVCSSDLKGEFEGMAEKIKLPEWAPDCGPAERHPTAGTVAIGARMPLVAYNINLNTPDLEIASRIAKNIRHINGGLWFVEKVGGGLKK